MIFQILTIEKLHDITVNKIATATKLQKKKKKKISGQYP